MPAEEYRAMKKEKELPKEANDVKLAKLQDAFIRKQDAKKIKENRDWDQLASQLKPIFSAQQGDIQEMLKPFPETQRDQAKLVLNLLSRLPKVTLSQKQLLIDGQPLADSLNTIVRDILKNDVRGVESLIQVLRRGPRTIPPQLAMETIDVEDSPSLYATVVPKRSRKETFNDDDVDDEDTMDALIPYTPLLLHAEEPASSSTPRKVTPIKKTPKVKRTPETTQNPTKQSTPVGPGPRVQRSPIKTRSSKVQRSPIAVAATADPLMRESAKKKKQEAYWVSY